MALIGKLKDFLNTLELKELASKLDPYITHPAITGGSFSGTMDDIADGATYVKTENNYNDAAVTKLGGIAAGAEVNINADWNAVSGDAEILNKPTVPTLPSIATGSEVDTGTDNAKMVTPKAIEDSSYIKSAALPVKASTSEVNAGTDDAKFVTSAAIYGSSYLDNVKAAGLTDISDAEIDLDNHSLILIDTGDSTIKKITFANLKKYLDTLYTPL